MASTIEFIRQMNQKSGSLRPEEMGRLLVAGEPADDDKTTEIVFVDSFNTIEEFDKPPESYDVELPKPDLSPPRKVITPMTQYELMRAAYPELEVHSNFEEVHVTSAQLPEADLPVAEIPDTEISPHQAEPDSRTREKLEPNQSPPAQSRSNYVPLRRADSVQPAAAKDCVEESTEECVKESAEECVKDCVKDCSEECTESSNQPKAAWPIEVIADDSSLPQAPVAVPTEKSVEPQRLELPTDTSIADDISAVLSLNESRTDSPHRRVRPITQSLAGSSVFTRTGSSPDVQKLADRITEQYPPHSPAVMLFVSSDNENELQAEVSHEVGTELASRSQSNVLLIDSVFRYGQVPEPGFAELVNGSSPLKDCVRESGRGNLYLMHAGLGDLTVRKTRPESLKKLSEVLKQNFQYVCIASPQADDFLTGHLSRFADVCYMVLDLPNSTQSTAEAHINLLRRSGARIGGCILRQPQNWTA